MPFLTWSRQPVSANRAVSEQQAPGQANLGPTQPVFHMGYVDGGLRWQTPDWTDPTGHRKLTMASIDGGKTWVGYTGTTRPEFVYTGEGTITQDSVKGLLINGNSPTDEQKAQIIPYGTGPDTNPHGTDGTGARGQQLIIRHTLPDGTVNTYLTDLEKWGLGGDYWTAGPVPSAGLFATDVRLTRPTPPPVGQGAPIPPAVEQERELRERVERDTSGLGYGEGPPPGPVLGGIAPVFAPTDTATRAATGAAHGVLKTHLFQGVSNWVTESTGRASEVARLQANATAVIAQAEADRRVAAAAVSAERLREQANAARVRASIATIRPNLPRTNITTKPVTRVTPVTRDDVDVVWTEEPKKRYVPTETSRVTRSSTTRGASPEDLITS